MYVSGQPWRGMPPLGLRQSPSGRTHLLRQIHKWSTGAMCTTRWRTIIRPFHPCLFLSETTCSAQYTAIPSTICTVVPGSTAICYTPGDRAIFLSMKITPSWILSPRDEAWSPADPAPLTEHKVFQRSSDGLLTAQPIILSLSNETQGVYSQLELAVLAGFFLNHQCCAPSFFSKASDLSLHCYFQHPFITYFHL